ncbi:MAG: ABC-three component system protein [Acidobacteriota bacterium]
MRVSRDDTVSLEVFDDVGVELSSGSKIAEQSKSTRGGNPVSDRSIDLWKTFSNWLNAIEKGLLNVSNTHFLIYVSKEVGGPIVDSFSSARDESSASVALDNAREALWGKPPGFPERSKVSEGIRDFVDHVLNADRRVVCTLISRFSLECGSGNPINDVEDEFGRVFIGDQNLSHLIKYAHGWVKVETDKLIAAEQPAYIRKENFHTEITAYIQKIDRRAILQTFAPAPSPEQIMADISFRTYVRQLDLIESDYDEKLTAVKDFLLSSADRTTWSEVGLVHESSFDDFEADLIRIWKSQKTLSDIEHSEKGPIVQGKSLFARCSLQKCTLESLEVPGHFVPGSFHALSDQKMVGWHPNYKDELKRSDSDESDETE